MLKVGVTGGIGSGKSMVCRIFEIIGTPVYNADQRAKELQEESKDVKDQIEQRFGASIYDKVGCLRKKRLADIVFNDEEALQDLNAIVHPAVAEDFKGWIKNYSEKSYIVKEAALIFEAGSDRQLDKVITVSAPRSLRIHRIKKRDEVSEQAVKNRMKRQWPSTYKEKKADFVIYNDEKQSVIRQVWQIHQKLVDERS